ncbi:5-carboxymethylaminomethyluridine-tRNA synthase GTPase subunit [Gammaproteobacteria bacterium]
MMVTSDTIAAPATPPGRGGVGIVRISGSLALSIAQTILKKTPKTQYVNFCNFFSASGKIIDQGLAIYFCAPRSFTGEDILELHCHGGPVIMDLLLQRVLMLGARMAKPGEFMERAFLNHKIDLIQAEAVADLIDAASSQAAQNAVRSLQGEFSRQVNKLLTMLIKLRAPLEATIDFPEDEETEKLAIESLDPNISNILLQIKQLKNTAKQGAILRDGVTVVIAGKPNAGKSSLFNCLSGQETAIVTAIPGTTRDVLHARIQIDGLPINLLDTAGLRDQPDIIEGEGIRRAWEEIKKADHVLLVVDAFTRLDRDPAKLWHDFFGVMPKHAHFTVLYNKIDLQSEEAKIVKINNMECIYLSVKTQAGLNLLKQHIKNSAGFHAVENGFSARRRHLDALDQAEKHLLNAQHILLTGSFELVAEDLVQAQRSLGEITGEFTADDLLEKIFSEFCLGK